MWLVSLNFVFNIKNSGRIRSIFRRNLSNSYYAGFSFRRCFLCEFSLIIGWTDFWMFNYLVDTNRNVADKLLNLIHIPSVLIFPSAGRWNITSDFIPTKDKSAKFRYSSFIPIVKGIFGSECRWVSRRIFNEATQDPCDKRIQKELGRLRPQS